MIAQDVDPQNARGVDQPMTIFEWPHETGLRGESAYFSARNRLPHQYRALQDMFAPHLGSDVCRVCYAVEGFRVKRPDAITRGFLWRLFDTKVPFIEMRSIHDHHKRRDAPIPAYPPGDDATFIRKAEIILELNGQWPALGLQEYTRREKLEEVSYDALIHLPDSELKSIFRHSSEGGVVFLPRLRHIGGARPVGPFLDPKLVESWIQQCKANHNVCYQQCKPPFPVELILIDTKNDSIMKVAPGAKPPYLALSYVWGATLQPELTKATLEQRSVKGGLAELCIPQTVLDAIHLAKMMGYRYLWVDALCIVQDDISIRHHQIAQMYNIYQSADVTIVAAGGSMSSHAITGVSSDRGPFPAQDIAGLPFMKLPASMKYSVESSKWKTRGWTFQEELCSQRLLVLLPDRAVFTCPSALCREDLCFEVSLDTHTSQNSREGLTLLSVTIRSLENASREQQIDLFQGLVKQYMHRTFSRDDDMENAFAGVSRMLEPVIGPSYHGIPEKYFAETIHGCWFWDTSLIRREGGFPSWSWVGWIYGPQQSDVGIRPMAGQHCVLHFYRWDADNGIQKLGPSSPPLEALGDESPLKFSHFVPDEETTRAIFTVLQPFLANAQVSRLITFTTSSATLVLGGPLRQSNFTSQTIKEYPVVHPYTGKHLTSIRLNSEFVTQTGKTHQFILIAYDGNSDSFRLMLVSPTPEDRQIVERVNVTVQNRLVRADDWFSLGPEKAIIIMD